MSWQGHYATLGAVVGLSILLVVKGEAAVEQLDDMTEDAVGLRHQLTVGAVHLVCPHTVLRLRAGRSGALLFRAAHVLRRLESRHSTRLMRAALDDAAPADGALAARPSPGAPKRQATRRGAFG